MIELQHVSAGYGAQDVVRDVSFAAPNGQLTVLAPMAAAKPLCCAP